MISHGRNPTVFFCKVCLVPQNPKKKILNVLYFYFNLLNVKLTIKLKLFFLGSKDVLRFVKTCKNSDQQKFLFSFTSLSTQRTKNCQSRFLCGNLTTKQDYFTRGMEVSTGKKRLNKIKKPNMILQSDYCNSPKNCN